MIKIYDINDKLLMQAEVTSAAKREQEMSKSDYIILSFSAAEKVILPVGAYINYTYKIDKVREVTRKFLLLESYEPIQTDECSWKYTPQFQHPKMILSKTPFFIYTRNSQNVEVKQNVWSFVGITSVLSGKIADFLNKDLMFGECGWKVIFSNVTANTVNVSFSDNDFISALTAITNAIGDNCEWHIDYDDEIIYIGKVLVGATPVVLEVGKNVGVPNISNSKESYYNAFSIFGGTRNITQVNSKGENVSSGDIRLQLDEGNGTISIDGKERSYSIDKYSTLDLRVDKINEPLFTKVLDFSQIFPSLNTYVYNVRGRVKYVLDEKNNRIPISNADGSIKGYKTFTVWYMRLAYPTTEKVEGKTIINTTVDDGITHYWYDFQITDDLRINGKNIGCSFEANFNTGALSTPLAGHGSNGEYVGFELTYHKEASSSHTSDDVSASNFSILAGDYEIIYQEDNEVIIPTNEAEMLIPRGENMPSLKCNITILYNIAMADTIYYENAQNRLLEKAKEEIVRLLSDLNNYEVKSYSDVFLEDNPQLQIGQSVIYKDGHGYELATRVLKLSTNIDYDFIQSITIGNQAIKGTITQLKEDVQTIIASGGNGGNGGGFSVSQLRSLIAKYGSDNFISKQFDDIAHGTITWEKIQKLLSGLLVGNFNNENGGSWNTDAAGRSHLITDYLEVRMKAIFEELVVKKTSTIGGKEIISPAGGVVAHKVEEVTVTYNNVSQKAYRCYFLAEQEGDAVDNDFAIGDQVRSESFNVRKGTYHKVGNHFYWRLIIGRDEEPVELEGKKYHYIDLSDTDCATASDVPAKGDVLSQCGNRTDAERQNCLIFSAVDTYSPSVGLYHGINSYSFANKEFVQYGVNKQTNKAFFYVYGDMYVGDRPTKDNGYEGSSYIKFDSKSKQVEIKGKISAKSTVDGKTLDKYIADNAPSGLDEEAVTNIINNSQVISDLQNQIDGAIETWFYDGEPTLSNKPASDWKTDKDKNIHLGDLYYDNKTGKAYRFAMDGSTYKWAIITDTDLTKALADSKKALDDAAAADKKAGNAQTSADGAQATANQKRRIFSVQPTPPYDKNDLWVNATYPSDGTTYKNDILKCITAKTSGTSFAIADWAKASKYTDDTALNSFKEEYNEQMKSYKEQLDGKVETWFYAYEPTISNVPASSWTTDALKSEHAGDLFYNTSNGYTYRWTGSAWSRIKDKDINTAMTAASKAQDTANGKRTVFTSQPTVPYDEGDLWASGGEDGKTLMVCVKSRTSGSFTSSEWVKANDSDLNAFAKTIEESLKGIQDQLDKKAETWYQTADPSTSWTTDAAKKEHKGDLWYNTSNNQTFFWNGAKWDKQDVPTEVFDKIDGKSSIYVSKPASYEERDLWILEAAYTLGGVAYSKGELVVATKTNASFSAADWTKKVKYTDDTVANAAKKAAEEAKKAADTAQTNITNLEKTVTTNKKAFDSYVTDGYLEPSEIAAMAQDSKRLEDDFAAAEKSYNEVKGAEVLKSTKELTDLNTAFTTLTTAKTELVTYLSDISSRYNAADTKGKATIVSAVGTKFTNFQSAYSAFYDKLGLANAYITSKIYGDLGVVVGDVTSLAYLKKALMDAPDTEINGGLILTSLIGLRDTGGNTTAGINGITEKSAKGGGIAAWFGGEMVDKDYNDGSKTPANTIFRFDGSGYVAGGAIWWGTDGRVHADPTSFIISEKNLGAYLTFFEPTWKAGSAGTSVADLVSLKPNAPFSKLGVSGDATFEGAITFHGISITYDATNKAIKIDGNLYATGGISAYGAGTSTSTGGGLNGSVKSYADALKLTSESLSEVASAYSIKALSSRIDNISTELGGLSLSWNNITGKPSTFAPSAHTHKWADITDRITKVSQLTNDAGYLTAHQSLASYYTKTEIDAKGYTTNKGTVTSVALTLPTGLECATKTITTSGTFAISLASGYSIPTTTKQTAWDSAYDWYVLMTTDEETADGIINKWNEVVSFLANIAQTDTLSGIVDGINKSISDEVTRAKKAEGLNASGISANKTNITTLQGYFTNGSAKKALQLTNARKLWGNSFNGTSDINGSIIVPSGKYISIGNIKMEYDATNKALKITNTTTEEVANLYTSGGVSAYGAGTSSSSGGGGLNGSVKSYSDALKLTSESLSEIASAYSIKQLSTRITSLEGGSATSISVSGSGNAVTSITKNGTTISVVKGSTFLTSHQSLSAYLKSADAANTYLKLSGGAMTGNIRYKGSNSTYDMITFVDNNVDVYGNGICIGGGGLTIIGGGESANEVLKQYTSGGEEHMIVANDVTIDFFSNLQDGWNSRKAGSFDTSGYWKGAGFKKDNSSDSYVLLGGGGHKAISSLSVNYANSAGSANSVAWSNVSGRPTKVSQFTNDSGYITSSASITGNAATATKLATARNIALGHDFRGSANFDGTGNITINGHINAAIIGLGSTDPSPFKRIAHVQVSSSWNDNALLLYLSQGYVGGNFGICRVEFRTDDVSEAGAASASVKWLFRYGYATDNVQVGFYSAKHNSYMDVFVKTTGSYQGTVIRCLQDSRGGINSNVSLLKATATTETYTSIEAAATALYKLAYTAIVKGSDAGAVNYANSAGNAGTLDGIHANGLFTNLSNNGNNLSITIGGTNKTVTVGYATKAAQLNTARSLWGQSFDGTGNVNGTLTVTNSSEAESIIRCSNTNGQIDLLTSFNRGVYDRTKTRWLIATNGANSWLDCGNVGIGTNAPAYKLDVSGDARATNFRGALVGNAATATKLQTARTIWGQSFNGTANVNGNITGVDNITMSNNSYLYGKNTGGTAIQLIAMASWNSVDIGRGALTNGYTTQVMGKTVALTASDDSGKNVKSVELSTAKLYSNVNIETEGGLLAHGGVTAYSSSDIRLKQDLRKLDYLGIIKAMGGTFGFAWKKDNTRSIGWIAQHVLCNPHLKDIVETDDKGYYKINYWSPKLIATAFGAIEQVGDEVSRLKARVVFLESEVQRLSGDKEDCNKKRLDNKNINLLN